MKCQGEIRMGGCGRDAVLALDTDYGIYHVCQECAQALEDAGYARRIQAEGDMACTAVTLCMDGDQYECRWDNLTILVYVKDWGDVLVCDGRQANLGDGLDPLPWVQAGIRVPAKIQRRHDKLIDGFTGDPGDDGGTMLIMRNDIACWLEQRAAALAPFGHLGVYGREALTA